MANIKQVECVWNGQPAIKYMTRAKIDKANAWQELDIPAEKEGVVYIRLVNEESAKTILVCELKNPPDNNAPYFTIPSGLGEERWWRSKQEGIPRYINVQGDTIGNDYYYEYVILK